MAGWTNKGKYRCLAGWINQTMNLALLKSTPDADDNTMADVTQIATGNGYTDGGLAVVLADWDVLTEDDTNDKAFAQLVDQVWTAAGGPLPSDSAGATYAALTDNNATVASRELFHYFSLTSARLVSVGQPLTLQNIEIDLAEA